VPRPTTARRRSLILLPLAAVLAAPPAGAARVRIDARSGMLAYPVIGPDGFVVLDERVVQSRVLLRVDDLLPVDPDSPDPAAEPDVAIGCSLRWFADPGVSSAAVEPSDLRFVPSLDDAALEVLWAWVEATNLLERWLDVRAGRMVHDGPLGWRSDDGAMLRLGVPGLVEARIVGGFENVRGLRLSNSPFAPEGVERWSAEGEGAGRYDLNAEPEHRPTVEAGLSARVGPAGVDAGYRRTWRSVDGGRAEEMFGFEASVDAGPISAFGSTRLDLVTIDVADGSAEVSARLDDGRQRIDARYEYFRPTFDAESIFRVFAFEPFHEVSLRYRFPLRGALRGTAWVGARHVDAPEGGEEPATLAGPFTDLGGGFGLGLDLRAFSADLRWKAMFGSTTSLAGADLIVDVPLSTRWSLFAVGSGWQWEDALRDGSCGVGGAGRLGAAVRVVEGVRVDGEAQVAHDTREGTTFAAFVWLDLAVVL
jgi:hypothetical protein